jgi:hypothetical protein
VRRPVLPCAAAAAAAVAAALAAATAEAAAAIVRLAERQMQMQHQQLLRVRSDVQRAQQLPLHCLTHSAAAWGIVCFPMCVCSGRAGSLEWRKGRSVLGWQVGQGLWGIVLVDLFLGGDRVFDSNIYRQAGIAVVRSWAGLLCVADPGAMSGQLPVPALVYMPWCSAFS